MAGNNQGTDPLSTLDANVRIERADGRIILRIDGVDRMYLSGEVGKLSAPGVDVKTATDDELIWSSNFKNLKIVDSDTIVFTPTDFSTIGGGAYFTKTAQFTFAHGLSSTPVVMAWVEFPGGVGGPTHTLPYTVYDFATGMPAYIVEATADATTISFIIRSTSVLGPQVPIRYYVLQETASTA